MTDDTALRNLRNRVLDEEAAVAGLLRTCVMLGSHTGSDKLKKWAQAELHGYSDDAELPDYRKLLLPLYMNSQGGPNFRRGEPISVFHLPEDMQEAVSGPLQFRNPIHELAELADSADSSFQLSRPGFAEIAAVWSGRMPMFQKVDNIYFRVSRSAIAGIVDIVRTTLVELVADITAGLPVDELPSRSTVDTAVSVNVYGGSQDNNTIHVGTNSGVIGQGTGSSQSQTNGLVGADIAALITELRTAAREIPDSADRGDVDQAIDDFESTVSADQPDPAEVGRRVSMLRRLGTAVGGALLAALSSEGAARALEAVGVS
jgi:hypothetical protein